MPNTDVVTIDTDWKILEIPLSLLQPFSGNRILRMSAIPQLAQSIERTRLIHPIAVAEDLENDNRYIVLSGHRRTEAYRLLNKKYPSGEYSKIKAIVVTDKEAKNIEKLKKIWIDANIETRKLTLPEIINLIDMFLTTISGMSEREARETINQMKGLELDEDKFNQLRPRAKMINKAEYIYEQFKNLDITEWSVSSIRNYIHVAEKGIDEVRQAFLESKIPLYIAKDISKYTDDTQARLLQSFIMDPLNYESNKKSILMKKENKTPRAMVLNFNSIVKVMTKTNRSIDLMMNKAKHVSDDDISVMIAMLDYIADLSNEMNKKLDKIIQIKDEN